MKTLVVLTVLTTGALAWVGTALAGDVRLTQPLAVHVTTDPRLDAVASQIAGRPVTVGCYTHTEPEAPWAMGAWGYVYVGSSYEYLDETVCDGAQAILNGDQTVPLWKSAIGTLVLAHESYHLNRGVREPGNEAYTECHAIRAAGRTIRLLGGDNGAVGTLMPYILAMHWRISAKYPQYYFPECRVPWWW